MFTTDGGKEKKNCWFAAVGGEKSGHKIHPDFINIYL